MKFYSLKTSTGLFISKYFFNSASVLLKFCMNWAKMLLSVQFDWKLLITYSGFRLINILLRKFDTSLEKEMKMIKTSSFLMYIHQQQKPAMKVYVNIKSHSLLRTRPADPWCKHARNYRDTDIDGKKLSVEYTCCCLIHITIIMLRQIFSTFVSISRPRSIYIYYYLCIYLW